jgi:autotransporter-associated beta strand protein
MKPKFQTRQFAKNLFIAFTLAAVCSVPFVHAAPLYFDATNANNLTPGAADWNTSGGLAWQTTTTPGTAAPITWTNGETATFQTNSTNTVTVSGTVIAEGIAQTASGGTGTTISGGTIQLGTAGISHTTGGSTTLTVNSAINLATTATTFNADNSTSRFITLGGSVGELTAGSAITKTGAGALTFNAVNTYTGNTNISAGTIRVGVDNAINSASVVNFTTINGSKLEVRASTVTIAGLSSATNNNLTVDTGAAAASNTLIIDTPVSTSYTYGGALNNGSGPGTLNLVKNGLGTQTITKSTVNSTFSGTIAINNGVLAFGSTSSFGTGSVTIDTPGTLAYNAGLSQTQLNRVTAGSTGTIALGVNANPTLTFVGRDNLYLGSTGNFSFSTSAANFTPGTNGYLLGGGGGTLTMSATNQLTGAIPVTVRGNVTLSVNQNYSGVTTVNSGKFSVNGLLSNSAVSVNNVGTILATDASATFGSTITINTGAILAPGDSAAAGVIGTLVAGGNTSISGTYACDVNGATTDLLAITGDLNLTGSTLAVSATTPSEASYTIATYTGTLTGTFNASPALPAGYTLDYATSGQIKLVSGAPPVSAYDTFASVIPNAADRDPTDDPDADGISNLAEFVLGGSPIVSSQAILPTQAIDATNIVLSYKRTDASEEAPATTSVGQYSTDLVNWTNVTPELVNENAAAADDMTITVPKSNEVNGKLFVRVRFVK